MISHRDSLRGAFVSGWAAALFLGCGAASPGPIEQENRAGTTGSGGTQALAGGATATATGGTLALAGGSSGGNASTGLAAGGRSVGGKAAGGNPTGGNPSSATGGVVAGGNSAWAGAATGGKAGSGGAPTSGGATTGGKATGGLPTTGGATTGGATTGGKATGGLPTTGGAPSGGTNAAGSGGCLDGPGVVVPAGYQLVWADEFNVDGAPDSSNWGYETGFVRNEEAQFYQSDNSKVEKGCLIIEARRERKTNPNYQAGSSDWKTNRQYAEYTSSSLRTMGKRSWQYGRFEMRGRIKAQAGLWPAWWTLGVAKEWPSCGEIDIMEYYAGMLRANVACGTATRWQAKWDGAAWNVATFEDKDWENKFHTWRMDWDAVKIDLYVDDKLVNTSNLSDMLNSDGSSPFKQAHYMLVNLAIGGNNGGDASKTAFPSRYEVDYIRVFQKP